MTFFGCNHSHTTFPQRAHGTDYVVCLNCGTEFKYDWATMRVLGELKEDSWKLKTQLNWCSQ